MPDALHVLGLDLGTKTTGYTILDSNRTYSFASCAKADSEAPSVQLKEMGFIDLSKQEGTASSRLADTSSPPAQISTTRRRLWRSGSPS